MRSHFTISSDIRQILGNYEAGIAPLTVWATIKSRLEPAKSDQNQQLTVSNRQNTPFKLQQSAPSLSLPAALVSAGSSCRRG
jgi:hypothetical protein